MEKSLSETGLESEIRDVDGQVKEGWWDDESQKVVLRYNVKWKKKCIIVCFFLAPQK